MARFKLLVGRFYDVFEDANKKSDRKMFQTGDVIQSEEDLVVKFPNKFERIVEAPPVAVTAARRATVQQLIDSDAWQEDDRSFLEELPDSHFTRILRQSGQEMAVDEEAEKPPEKKTPASKFGDDVTKEFPEAEEAHLKVFKNAAEKYQILKENGKKPLNAKPLDVTEILAFIEEQQKE